ncbi:MAG: preprotein translocase subunit Sec61beta [Candidatus Nanoarchaeia archaeon]|nr:preprotein translocase subunit Sec61beta [Candidatus Nanoarchaeia archaeon]
MSQDKIQMPTSGGGLVRYSEEAKSKIEIKPEVVVVILAVVIVIGLILKFTL